MILKVCGLFQLFLMTYTGNLQLRFYVVQKFCLEFSLIFDILYLEVILFLSIPVKFAESIFDIFYRIYYVFILFFNSNFLTENFVYILLNFYYLFFFLSIFQFSVFSFLSFLSKAFWSSRKIFNNTGLVLKIMNFFQFFQLNFLVNCNDKNQKLSDRLP